MANDNEFQFPYCLYNGFDGLSKVMKLVTLHVVNRFLIMLPTWFKVFTTLNRRVKITSRIAQLN